MIPNTIPVVELSSFKGREIDDFVQNITEMFKEHEILLLCDSGKPLVYLLSPAMTNQAVKDYFIRKLAGG